MDLYSRKIVGWEVHESGHLDHFVPLVRCAVLAEGGAFHEDQPLLHGAKFQVITVNWLGVKSSHSCSV